MALQGSLKILGQKNTYDIIQCEYSFRQNVDDTGKPSSRPRGGVIKFIMPATSDDDVFFYKWMIHKTQVESGLFRFCVFSANNKRSYKSVQFLNAYCIELSDFFNDQDSKLMYTTVTISAEVIRIGVGDSVMLINEWGGSMETMQTKFESIMSSIGADSWF